MVTRQDKNIIRIDHIHKIQILVNRISSSLIPVRRILVIHIWGQHESPSVLGIKIPAASISDVPVQFQWLVLC